MLLYQTSVISIILTMCLQYTEEYTGTYDHPVVNSSTNHPLVTSPTYGHSLVTSYTNDHHVMNSSTNHPVVLPLRGLPYIDQYHGVNQTIQQGETVYIGCRVYNVGNR